MLAEREKEEEEDGRQDREEEEARDRGHETAEKIRNDERVSSEILNAAATTKTTTTKTTTTKTTTTKKSTKKSATVPKQPERKKADDVPKERGTKNRKKSARSGHSDSDSVSSDESVVEPTPAKKKPGRIVIRDDDNSSSDDSPVVLRKRKPTGSSLRNSGEEGVKSKNDQSKKARTGKKKETKMKEMVVEEQEEVIGDNKSEAEEENKENAGSDREGEENAGSVPPFYIIDFLPKRNRFVVKFSIDGDPEEAAAKAVIQDCAEAGLRMIWQHSRSNPRVADWINNVKWIRKLRRGWSGIEQLAYERGWEGSFEVAEAAAVATPVVAAAEPVTPTRQIAQDFESPFDSAEKRSPTIPPRSVGVFDHGGGGGELSEMEESAATVESVGKVLCTGWHQWFDYEGPGYEPLENVMSCWKCGVGFYPNGPYRIKLTSPVHYCTDCKIVVCTGCRRDMLVLNSPPKENRRRRRV